MSEALTFHFEGALADSHRMNFYECARFQYAAARLMVKLAQFRNQGKFAKKITNSSNFNIDLVSQSDGSFNINVEDSGQSTHDNPFIEISLADLIAYVSERIIEKVDDDTLSNAAISNRGRQSIRDIADEDPAAALNKLVQAAMDDRALTTNLPAEVQDLVKRRVAELYRERRLTLSQPAISRIDAARSQKLIAMSAPLISEMATALRRSADTLEVTSSVNGQNKSVLFLNREMAKEIEISAVDEDITPILGDITQFNKDNGWGKLKIENGAKTLSFSIPYDLLPTMRQKLIEHMKRDLVYLQSYFVRNHAGEVVRLIAVGILPTPSE
ncbi:hypothetical protein D9623_29780 [Azospirillum brasilense]|jgi:hypothetical protein|uniref:Uncharacterized protein n=1 Tax=Azospirillum brasilense TaxID=192 RepID=A0A4D8QY64_AZOBR|nr:MULTISPECIES: hypothetical protein [Azospirillum]MDW7553246.1 hypothetical protein [Azospirillum brasilense]MDW7593375.1 hypothetical protein [Azospirillum brasilense]MDW7628565.1 hypothetical protein [Azospirillum brasilense]MDX5955340.1 hypothetical protein [Azospirillum brasilense]QCO12049.1 hypothetical protein D3868_23670 [Azospirillum brasilense]